MSIFLSCLTLDLQWLPHSIQYIKLFSQLVQNCFVF